MRGFRNLADADIAVPDAGLVVVGPNGHGKTSLLEAALYCQVFRSVRGAADRQLVRWGADGFHVAVDTDGSVAADRSVGTAVAAGYDARTGEKRVTVEGKPPEHPAEAIGIVRGVVLSPLDVQLVAGGPRERRRFLDVLLSLTVHGYVEALARYRRALRHRARASTAELPSWDRMLAERGAVLVGARRAWAAKWCARYAELCAAVGERGASTLAYQPSVAGEGAEAIFAALERQRARAEGRGALAIRTLAGPHRDELRLELDGRDLRHYGSAGQQRTAALALRLCEAESLRDATGAGVGVCLDDAFAELDAERSARLAALIEGFTAGGGAQVLAAVPKASDLPAGLSAGRLEVRQMREGRLT